MLNPGHKCFNWLSKPLKLAFSPFIFSITALYLFVFLLLRFESFWIFLTHCPLTHLKNILAVYHPLNSLTPSGAQNDFWRDATVPPTVQSCLAPLLTSDYHLPLIFVLSNLFITGHQITILSFFFFLPSRIKGSAVKSKSPGCWY